MGDDSTLLYKSQSLYVHAIKIYTISTQSPCDILLSHDVRQGKLKLKLSFQQRIN